MKFVDDQFQHQAWATTTNNVHPCSWAFIQHFISVTDNCNFTLRSLLVSALDRERSLRTTHASNIHADVEVHNAPFIAAVSRILT